MDSYISFECYFIRLFSNRKIANEALPRKKKVLLLRKDVIGDFILFIPTLKYYREFYKDAEISLVVNTVALELSSQFKFIDNIIPYNGKLFRSNFLYRRNFFRDLAKAGFDIVVHAVYSREYICDRMVRATGATETIAFRADCGPMHTDNQYTRIIEIDSSIGESERNMRFAQEVTGIVGKAEFPNLDLSLFASNEADTLLSGNNLEEKKFVVLFAGAGSRNRTWQLEKFAEVADFIIEKYSLKVALCGGKGETSLSTKIIELIKHKSEVIDLTGKTDIPNLAHVLNRSLFYFGSDTGPMHLAVAVGTPVICILGGGHLNRFFPYGDLNINRYIADKNAACRGDSWKCSENLAPDETAPCIRNISVDDAKHEIDSLLAIIQK